MDKFKQQMFFAAFQGQTICEGDLGSPLVFSRQITAVRSPDLYQDRIRRKEGI